MGEDYNKQIEERVPKKVETLGNRYEVTFSNTDNNSSNIEVEISESIRLR